MLSSRLLVLKGEGGFILLKTRFYWLHQTHSPTQWSRGEPVVSSFLLKQPNSKSFLTLCWNNKILLVGTDALPLCESPLTIRGYDSIQSSIHDGKITRFNLPVTLPLPEDVLLAFE